MSKKEVSETEMEKIDRDLQNLANYIIDKMKHVIMEDLSKVVSSMVEAQREEIKLLRSSTRKMARLMEKTNERFNDFVHKHNALLMQKDIHISTLEQRIQQLHIKREAP